jgi:glycosyltransferase involved in cell wall biosynthesis
MIHAATGEGFPLAMQEAVASGVPLVALWDEGYEGWVERGVIAACDDLGELAGAVEHVARSEPTRIRLGARGRAWAEARWSWRRTADEYEEVYREVCARARHD